MIWPEANLGATIVMFRTFMEEIVAQAEKHHLASFWEKLERGKGIFPIYS